MGAIKSIIDSFDQSDEVAQVQKEAVEALAALGQAKANTYKLQIEESLLSVGNGTNITVPVSAILRSLVDVRAYSSTEVSNIGNAVKNALGKFVKRTSESVVDGIGSLITDTLSIFLGTSSASTGTTEQYYVATEGLSVIRVIIK